MKGEYIYNMSQVNGNELEALYIERGELEARLRELEAEGKTYSTDEEYARLDDDLYIVNKAIDEIEWNNYVNNGGCDIDMGANVVSEEVMDKRRLLYAELRERYLMEVWKGEMNEVSDTLNCYEESVVHFGVFDVGWTFFMDELYNYGKTGLDLQEKIKEIVEYDKYAWHDGAWNDDNDNWEDEDYDEEDI